MPNVVNIPTGQECGALTNDGDRIFGFYQGLDENGHAIRTPRDGIFYTQYLFTTYRECKEAQQAMKRPPAVGQIEMFK